MSTPIRAADGEHFAIVRDSLASDGLHLAMVARDRRLLQDYAAELARTLARDDDLRVEAYDASRLESLIVELTLERFDGALSRIAGEGRSPERGLSAAPDRPDCVLFIPDAQQLPRAELNTLLRLAAGTRHNRLRLVAMFHSRHTGDCDQRIAAMGKQLARWDLDEEASEEAQAEAAASHPARAGGRRGLSGNRQVWRTALAAVMIAGLAILPLPSPLLPAAFTMSSSTSDADRSRFGAAEADLRVMQLAGEPRRTQTGGIGLLPTTSAGTEYDAPAEAFEVNESPKDPR